VILWSLFALWIMLNLADSELSYLAVSSRASEVGFLYYVSGSFLTMVINKTILSILIGLLLVYFKQSRILVALNIAMLSLCIWGTYVLLKQRGVI